MKRLIVSFAVLSLLFVYNYYSEKYVLDYCSYLDSTLERCADELKEKKYSSAENTADELMKSWEKNDIILSVFIGDSSVVEPEKSIISLYGSIGDKNYSYCLLAVRECQGYIHEICESTQTNFANIL
ncbi:MAG: DUF4363 family protein [Clostridia bacterium]|nr:DUF4363 family protein [Clostridia bacterium]